MVTLSLAMIIKDEEKVLERALSCAKAVCDELIVVDTGSTDRSVDIAEKMGAKVHHFTWVDNFSAARNHAFAQCTGDWIMWLDADDIIPEADQTKILQLKESVLNDDIDGVYMTYQYVFDNAGQCTHSILRERLIRRAAGLEWINPVHECIIIPYGRGLKRLDINIAHFPPQESMERKVGRNLRILEKAIANGDNSSRTLFYYSGELRDCKRWEEAIESYKKYLEISTVNWEKYGAMLSMAECYNQLDRKEDGLEWYLKAMILDSERAEAFNRIGKYFYDQQQWRKAMPFFYAAASLPRPADGLVSEADYQGLSYDYLGICYERLKEFPQAIDMTLKAFSKSPSNKGRLINNLHYMIDQL